MNIVLIVGPQAVGKMTVGEELEKKTGLNLLHNHMTIDLVTKFMTWDEGIDLIMMFRDEIMKKVAKGNSPGMIITFIWAFNLKSDWDYVDHIKTIFKKHKVHIVELNADVLTRLDRNVSENRLEKKPSKRNIEWSNNELVSSMQKHRMTSYQDEIQTENYLRIDNSRLSASETAEQIIEYFNLPRLESSE